MATRDTLVKRSLKTDASGSSKVVELQLPLQAQKVSATLYDDDELRTANYGKGVFFTVMESSPRDLAVALGILMLSAALRFYKIFHPPQVVAGWVIGYDGHFEFDSIGDDYIANKVPYIGLRSLPAIFGSLTPPMVYAIMRESGYPRIIGIFSSLLVALDNAHIVQARLILLDAPLLFFMSVAIYAYIRFYKLRYK
jgi:hypothetical protein